MHDLDKLKGCLETINRRTNPHGSNLLTKLLSRELSVGQSKALADLAPIYLRAADIAADETLEVNPWIDRYTASIDDYLTHLRSSIKGTFSHQSDLISSVIPEYICTILQRLVHVNHVVLEVDGQTDLIIELMFSPLENGSIHCKYKRVDAAVGLPTDLKFQTAGLTNFRYQL